MNVKRVGAGLAALALMGASSLGIAMNVAADDDPRDYNQYIIQDEVTGVPDGFTLVAEDVLPETYSEAMELIYGEDGVRILNEAEEEWYAEYERIYGRDDLTDDEKDDAFDAFMNEFMLDLFENKLGFYADDDIFIDFHLEDEDHQKQANDGSEIKIVLERVYELDPVNSDMKEILSNSEYEWEYAMLHIKDDGTREFIPLTIEDSTGKAWFTVTDFSTFVPVYRVLKDDEEAPKTSADLGVAATMAAIAVLSIAGACFCVRVASKR